MLTTSFQGTTAEMPAKVSSNRVACRIKSHFPNFLLWYSRCTTNVWRNPVELDVDVCLFQKSTLALLGNHCQTVMQSVYCAQADSWWIPVLARITVMWELQYLQQSAVQSKVRYYLCFNNFS